MRKALLPIVLLALAAVAARAQTWTALGPEGGDARVLAADPSHPARIFLGTADGHIFGSTDSGAHWTLFGRASARPDAVITAIVVDPRDGNVLFASSWNRDDVAGGGVYRSADGGRTWSAWGLEGQAVRALAMAASDPNVLAAGSLDGVYRSLAGSPSWQRISPEHDKELRNLDSLAVDPRDPQIIYAGTFHLPWKTADGGRTWHPVHEGMIDDSDVMSLLVDEGDSRRIYAGACSGIYRSDDGAAGWKKIQGIPYMARRTYSMAHDSVHPDSVYAATSEGLWKTADGGKNWRRVTPESWVINSVLVTGVSPTRILIGTEERGVLASEDGGEHFEESNAGFHHRQILAMGVDATRPGHLLAVLAHAPETAMETDDEGRTWLGISAGLPSGLRVLRVYAAPDGAWWVSLAQGGLLRYDSARKAWKQAGTVPAARVGAAGHSSLLAVVTDMAFRQGAWYAATSQGLLSSTDRGATWKPMLLGDLAALPAESVQVSSNGQRLRIASLRGLGFSEDGGNTWVWHDLPLDSGGAVTLQVQSNDESTIVAIARNGLYISRDTGKTWQAAAAGLPAAPVMDFASAGDMFTAAMRTGGLYVSRDAGRNWDRIQGSPGDGQFEAVVPSGKPGMVYAASATEGIYRIE